MKFRKGFVSNSSSTSFHIYGISFNNTKDLLGHLPDGLLTEKEIESTAVDEEVEWILEQKKLVTELDFQIYDEMGFCVVGMDIWSKMKDDETKTEFKSRALVELQKIFPSLKPDDLTDIEESWYNG